MMNRQILRIALPAIVTNITVPLLGLVDTAIVGHMGDAAYIGAIAVGSMIFNLVYWVFGFLRMGTSGLTAQAYGRGDFAEARALLRRSVLVAVVVSAVLLVLQWPLCELMLELIGPTADVRPLAATYFYIVVWGAPASLGLFALTGWYIGMQDTRTPMMVSILQNVVNILASLLLVYGLDMKVEGVALGTVIAQYAGVVMAGVKVEGGGWKAVLVEGGRWRVKGEMFKRLMYSPSTFHLPLSTRKTFHLPPSTLKTYRDIFLRTLFLVAVNLYFTRAGARQGATILAVNTLLMQLYLLFSYVMDGFAYAGEALGGRYWGAQDMPAYRAVVRRLFGWGAAMTLLFTAVYVLGGMPFLHLLTDEPSVVEASRDYVWWAYLIPVAGVAAFIWEGIFIGTTQTRGMLISSFIAAVVFFVGTFMLTKTMENHGLWLSMLLYLLTRGVVQTIIRK
ncbi:MAG: MATE family efflux transporter [Prevotella sp.]|nr:MATE family efflux transporter [Prevotella sp.]